MSRLRSLLSLFCLLVVAGCGSSNEVATFLAQSIPLVPLEEPADGVPLDAFVQIDLDVPFRPTTVRSGDSNLVLYELNVTNQIPVDYELRQVQVVDADTQQVIVDLQGAALREIVRLTGVPDLEEIEAPIPLSAGQRAIVFFFLEFPVGQPLPQNYTHRIIVRDQNDVLRTVNAEFSVALDTTAPPVFSPPLTGGPWLCDGAPSPTSYHRRTLLSINGLGRVSQRYAIDFEVLTPGGTTFTGDPSLNTSYPAYGQPVRAMIGGTVVKKFDGSPDNTPPMVPELTDPERAGGNAVIVDIGGGRFVVYGHMQPNSSPLQVGDVIATGDFVGLVGNSGNSFEPHLHVHLCDKDSFLGSQGLPFVFDSYQLVDGGMQVLVNNQIPIQSQVVFFDGALITQVDIGRLAFYQSRPKCDWR